MKMQRPQRNAIEDLLPRKAQPVGDVWPAPRQNARFVLCGEHSVEELYFLGLSRPASGVSWGFNPARVAVFGMFPPRHEVVGRDWEEISDSLGVVLVTAAEPDENLCLREQVQFLKPIRRSESLGIRANAFCLRRAKGARPVTYRLLATDYR